MGKDRKKSVNESKLKNCSSGVASPGSMGQEAPRLDSKVVEELTREMASTTITPFSSQ